MNEKTLVKGKINYVGVNDRNKHLFEGMWPLPYGVSYNSYLIADEQVALVDTVDACFFEVYLHKIRIQKALELLEGTHFSIGEIALRCGFCDANHLTKIFRSVTGTTPFSFRREKQLKTR